MRLVIDCSVAMKWLVDEDGSQLALSILRTKHELLLPDFWAAEATSVVWKQHRRGLITKDEAEWGLRLLLAMPRTSTLDMGLYWRALRIGMETGQSTYDTLYLAFAIVANADKLIVADARFLQTMRKDYGDLMMALEDWPAA